jgi:hypothetical protein
MRMSNPVQPVQPVNAVTQTQPAAAPPKNQQTTTPTAGPQDKVTISPQAHQALANNAKPASGGDVDHDGDNHQSVKPFSFGNLADDKGISSSADV